MRTTPKPNGGSVARPPRGALSHHPNVVPVYATGVAADGRPFLVMPYLPGGSWPSVSGAVLAADVDLGVSGLGNV